jgi:hypothetical protein
MPQSSVDLASIFQTVTQSLAENQQALNQADEFNQDHGDNMVQTFQTITNALEKKKGGSDSAALAYAAKQLSKSTTSSSGQLYAQNLTQAAGQFKGQKVDAQGALQLLQMLIGGGGQSAAQPSSGDMLGSLLGGLAGSEASQGQPTSQAGGDLLGSLLGGLASNEPSQPQPASQAGGDLLGALLGGMTGGSSQQQPASQGSGDLLGSLLGGLAGGASDSAGVSGSGAGSQGGLGLDDLLAAGMAFMQAKQSGGSNVQALVQAFLAGSGMGNTTHRTQSTEVVVNSFLQALNASANRN